MHPISTLQAPSRTVHFTCTLNKQYTLHAYSINNTLYMHPKSTPSKQYTLHAPYKHPTSTLNKQDTLHAP